MNLRSNPILFRTLFVVAVALVTAVFTFPGADLLSGAHARPMIVDWLATIALVAMLCATMLRMWDERGSTRNTVYYIGVVWGLGYADQYILDHTMQHPEWYPGQSFIESAPGMMPLFAAALVAGLIVGSLGVRIYKRRR